MDRRDSVGTGAGLAAGTGDTTWIDPLPVPGRIGTTIPTGVDQERGRIGTVGDRRPERTLIRTEPETDIGQFSRSLAARQVWTGPLIRPIARNLGRNVTESGGLGGRKIGRKEIQVQH